MDIETYITFVGVSLLLCIIPGPDMIYLLSRSVVSGKKAGIYAALGINSGTYVHLIAAVSGLTAILATSALAFTIVKWLGAAYLVYLGVSALLRKKQTLSSHVSQSTPISHRSIFWQGFLSDVLNPKVALFYLSILPQFVDPNTATPLTQLLVLGVTLNVIGITTNIAYVYFSTAMTRQLRANTRLSQWLHKALGGVFLGLGIKVATTQQ